MYKRNARRRRCPCLQVLLLVFDRDVSRSVQSHMHRLDTSRPAAVVSERERAIVETVRRLHGLPSTRTLAAYEAHLEHLSVWLAGEPLTDRRLARYILHQYETRGRKSVTSIVAAVNYYFHDAGWPSPHGPLTHRAILACAAADALRPWTTRTSTASYHTADIAAPQSRARTRARVDEGPSRRTGKPSSRESEVAPPNPKTSAGGPDRESEELLLSLFSGRSACKRRRAWTAEEDAALAAIAAENRDRGIRKPGVDSFARRLRKFAATYERTYGAVQKLRLKKEIIRTGPQLEELLKCCAQVRI